MSKIITVTLNPSLDRTLFINHLAEGYRNTVTEPTLLDPAGQGVNISRALAQLQAETHAIVLLGTDAIGKAYRTLIGEESFPTTLVRHQGLTRSNTIIYDRGKQHETQIVEEGDKQDDDEEVELVEERLQEVLGEGDTVCLTGHLPRGLSVDLYSTLVKLVRDKGGKAVLAAEGISFEIGLKAQPNIVSLRHNQLEAFFNYPVRTVDDVAYSARKLCDRSGGSVILVAHDELEYALLVTDEQSWLATMPETDAPEEGTTSGIHDAFLAGFLAHYRHSDDLASALRWALAAASYTRLQPGNEFGTLVDVQPQYDTVQIRELDA